MTHVSELHSDPARQRPLGRRHRIDRWFVWFCLSTAAGSVAILAIMLLAIFAQGLPGLTADFLKAPPSATPSEAGIRPALFGTIWVCGVCALFTLPIAIATAIFLEEFKPRRRRTQLFHGFVQLNISNLAGVPSVVYGIIGLTTFAGMFGLAGNHNDPLFEIGAQYYDQFLSEGDRIVLLRVEDSGSPPTPLTNGMIGLSSARQPVKLNVIGRRERLPTDAALLAYTLRSSAEAGRFSHKEWYYFRIPFGRGVLTGGLTLMLVVLPIVILASQESLRAVPDSLREGSLGMGATTWQTVRRVTLPAAVPGIMTGSILAMSRAIGEAAPILIICGIIYISSNPGNLMADFSVMPLQIYNWAAMPQAEFHAVAAKGIIVLLSLLLTFNAVAVFIRSKAQKSFT